jgi:hypothetical protein
MWVEDQLTQREIRVLQKLQMICNDAAPDLLTAASLEVSDKDLHDLEVNELIASEESRIGQRYRITPLGVGILQAVTEKNDGVMGFFRWKVESEVT